jgi:hypothetical protein
MEEKKYLSEQNLLKIKEVIQTELLKRGISAPIIKLNEFVKNGKNHIDLETDVFQTTPVLFKELKIISFSTSVYLENEVSVDSDKGFTFIKVYIGLDYRYQHFDGGSNGCSLFNIHFKVFGDKFDDARLSSIN